jgi:type VI protein secretion system component Hcp
VEISSIDDHALRKASERATPKLKKAIAQNRVAD